MSEIALRKLCCHLRPGYTAERKHRLSLLLNQDHVSSAARYQWLAHASWELRLAVDEIIGVPRGCGRQNNKRDPGKLRVWNPHSGDRALGNLGDTRTIIAVAQQATQQLWVPEPTPER